MDPGKQRLFQPGKTSAAQQLCPRLIDYVFIVGRRPNTTARRRRIPNGGQNVVVAGGLLSGAPSGGTISHPEILRRYPSENHKDFELARDVVYFCQPEGCLSFSGSGFRQLKRRHIFHEATSFVFMLTEKDTAKVRYGVTLNFFLCLGSNERKPHQTASATNTEQLQQQQQQQRPTSSHASASGSAHLVSLCLMSHHPFLSSFRDLLVLFRQLVDCCNHRANQDESLPRDAVWTVLTGHWPQGMSIPTTVMQEMRQLETWLFTLLSSPVPVPGKTKLLLEVLPPDMMPTPLEFALPDHTRFSLVDFPLHLPLELLGVDAVQQILAAIMLEYKVILQSRNYNAVSMCVMALVAFLYPLEYMFPVIPLLPVFMPSAEQLLLAPTPYIIGIPASFFQCKGIQVPSDVLLVDLDTNQLTMPTDPTVRIPKFPAPEAAVLKEEFLRALGRQNGVEAATSNGLSIDGDDIDVNCRVAMIHFYNGANIFANFSEHTRTIRLYPRPVVALQVDSFLRSRGQHNEFIAELCKTQAVEYFAECSLCPANETYVRVQAGVTSGQQIGDKAKWYSETLMPVHFNAYPYGSSLSEAIFLARIDKSEHLLELTDSDNIDDDESDYATTATPSDLESVGSADAGGWSPFGSRSPLSFDMSKPLSDAANDAYRAPQRLELPQSESALSIDSSDMSSCRSSPCSAVDSEADFARLAENLALKRNAKGDFTFDHCGQTSDEEETATICEDADGQRTVAAGRRGSIQELDSKPSKDAKQQPQMGHGERLSSSLFRGRPLLMGLNGYAERGQGVFSQMMRKTAPKAQALKDRAKPLLAEAMASNTSRRMEAASTKVGQFLHQNKQQKLSTEQSLVDSRGGIMAETEKQRQQRERDSAASAQLQRKNQQQLIEVCEQVLAGQGVGVFAGSKVKRLLEDESLRELVCSKLNLGLEVKYAEDEFIQDVQLSRQQYKGFLKLLQACTAGLEQSFNTPGSNGLASAFHVLEIAHTHFWTQVESGQGQNQLATTPGSGSGGTKSQALSPSPSISSQNLVIGGTPSTCSNSRTPPTGPISPQQQLSSNNFSEHPPQPSQAPASNFPPPNVQPPPVPPPSVPPPPLPANSALSNVFTLPPPSAAPPPLPARPPPLPPRNPSLTMAEPKEEANISKQPMTAREAPPSKPPPLPKRPNSAEGPQTNMIEEKPPLEVTVNDRVDVAVKQESKQQEQQRKPPPPTLDLKALEQMLPQASSAAELPPRHFLYEDLIGTLPSTSTATMSPNLLWQKMPFWETAFLDMVAQERDKIGMDSEPAEMIDRYSQLSEAERKRLELEEDRILATLLQNMTAMMHLCHVPLRTIQQKVRRLLGKAHIGLVYSKRINHLLDGLGTMPPNTKIPLKPLGSRLIQKMVFAVHEGSTPEGAMCFLEICDDAIILRTANGAVQERWWYERMVNMTFSPKTRVLCLWQRQEDQVHMYKFHTRKCRQLYNALKLAMERAASRGKYQSAGRDLGGEFPIHDVERNEGGLLQVRIDGIHLQFIFSQHLIELNNIKKCNTFGGNMFILEEYDRARGQLIQRRYISSVAPKIAWCLHRIFSIHTALGDCTPTTSEYLDQRALTVYNSPWDPKEHRVILPMRAMSVDSSGQQQQQEAPISTSKKAKRITAEMAQKLRALLLALPPSKSSSKALDKKRLIKAGKIKVAKNYLDEEEKPSEEPPPERPRSNSWNHQSQVPRIKCFQGQILLPMEF